MSEQDPAGIVKLPRPTQCALWTDPDRLSAGLAQHLAWIQGYEDTSHLSSSLYKCRECGQLYFYHWYEWVDWEEGHDEQYTTLLPVATQEQIEALRQADLGMFLDLVPRLQLDKGSISWIGRE